MPAPFNHAHDSANQHVGVLAGKSVQHAAHHAIGLNGTEQLGVFYLPGQKPLC